LNTSDHRLQLLTKLGVLYFIGLAVVILNFRFRKAFFSIRWKLLLLFLYANAAPLSVLGFIAYDYLQNKKIALKNELNLEAARFLRDFDARFDQQRNHFDNSLNRVINRINKKNPGKLRESDLNQLKTELKRFNVSETYLFAKDGKKIFAHSSDGKDLSSSIKYFSTMAEGILKYMNRIILKTNKDDILSKITSPEDSEFIRNSIRDSRKIWPITIGDSVKLGYWNYLGNPEKFQNNYYLLLMWSQDEFQKIYLRNHLDDLKKGLPDSLAFAKSIRSGKYLKEPENNANQLRKFMNRVEEKKSICNGEITYKSEDYIAVGMVGNNLNGMVLCTLFPSKEIEKKIGRTRNQFFAGALLSVVLTTLIGLMVARQFMTPVKKLSEAALQINQQNFRHRIEGMDQDEFGHLGEVVNRVIEGLGELEIAKVVQESLFPEESFSQPPFSVYGKSVVMTTLGGDYFDFFKIDDENFGVIIGDVAGHGVAAALIMAMAKARVRMTEKQQRLDPAGLVSLVHSIIHSLKSRNLRRMMTFQYLVLNSKTGKVTFTNAGHCFPLLVNRKNKSARFIEHIGSPLGAGRKARYENLEFSMTEGEALVLFTDGIIEARNKHGEMMGFEGFIDIVVKNYTENPEEYYKKIFAAYIAWAGEADDDTTMIVISRN
jgi:serine phosphatase RsbU (regulator of sigma subunit)